MIIPGLHPNEQQLCTLSNSLMAWLISWTVMKLKGKLLGDG